MTTGRVNNKEAEGRKKNEGKQEGRQEEERRNGVKRMKDNLAVTETSH